MHDDGRLFPAATLNSQPSPALLKRYPELADVPLIGASIRRLVLMLALKSRDG